MNRRSALQRFSLILGLISLALALWSGMHLQHLLDDSGNRHVGETLFGVVLALVVFAGSRFGARKSPDQ